MVEISLLALGHDEAELGRALAPRLGADLHVHDLIARPGELAYARIAERVAELWPQRRGLVLLCPCGVAVRSIAPLIVHKLTDPAVVVVDAGGRWAVSLLSGHEGGANALCLSVSNLMGGEPIITTTSEAARRLIVGIGCRRGTSAEAIVTAVDAGLAQVQATRAQVRLLASAGVKADEPGLHAAALQLRLPLRIVADAAIRAWNGPANPFVQSHVDLPAVAEPAALLAGRRTTCLLPRIVPVPGVTISIATEAWPQDDSAWWATAPAASTTAPAGPNGP